MTRAWYPSPAVLFWGVRGLPRHYSARPAK
jgi:hypothetical protein